MVFWWRWGGHYPNTRVTASCQTLCPHVHMSTRPHVHIRVHMVTWPHAAWCLSGRTFYKIWCFVLNLSFPLPVGQMWRFFEWFECFCNNAEVWTVGSNIVKLSLWALGHSDGTSHNFLFLFKGWYVIFSVTCEWSLLRLLLAADLCGGLFCVSSSSPSFVPIHSEQTWQWKCNLVSTCEHFPQSRVTSDLSASRP